MAGAQRLRLRAAQIGEAGDVRDRHDHHVGRGDLHPSAGDVQRDRPVAQVLAGCRIPHPVDVDRRPSARRTRCRRSPCGTYASSNVHGARAGPADGASSIAQPGLTTRLCGAFLPGRPPVAATDRLRADVDEDPRGRRGSHSGGDVLVATGPGEHRPVERREDVEITRARRSDRADHTGQARMEDGDEPGQRLDVLLEDHIGHRQRPLRTGLRMVVDLHGDGRDVLQFRMDHVGERVDTGDCPAAGRSAATSVTRILRRSTAAGGVGRRGRRHESSWSSWPVVGGRRDRGRGRRCRRTVVVVGTVVVHATVVVGAGTVSRVDATTACSGSAAARRQSSPEPLESPPPAACGSAAADVGDLLLAGAEERHHRPQLGCRPLRSGARAPCVAQRVEVGAAGSRSRRPTPWRTCRTGSP